MSWSFLPFKEWRSKTLPQMLFSDQDFFFWAWEEGVFKGKGDSLEREVEVIYKKARSIRIKQKSDEDLVVEYLIHPYTDKLIWGI